MFNPKKLEAILDVEDKDLLNLPQTEDDWHEYKSSKINDKELANKIAKAASGFWNSGGGLFVAGVNDKGQPDGGISLDVGRQSRRDWIDQVISRVEPKGNYLIQSIQKGLINLNIESEKGIFLIGFGASEIGPHMADNCYYIRAGAHTVPAKHFIVEAIYARRGLRNPLIKHIVRRKPEESRIIQLGIIVANSVPALDVSIEVDPLPESLRIFSNGRFPFRIPIISDQFPFFFDIDERISTQDETNLCFQVNLTYFNIEKQKHNQILKVNVDRQLGTHLTIGKGFQTTESQLKNINNNIGNLTKTVSQISDILKKKK